MDARERRLAQNEALFRDVNERIEELAKGHGGAPLAYEFLCECSNIDCTFRVELTLGDYEAVRAHGSRFIVLPEHVFPEVEHVAERHEGYWVVEKGGEAADFVEELDPRRPETS